MNCFFILQWNCIFSQLKKKKIDSELFNPFTNKPWFLRVCTLLKTLEKGEIARDEQFLHFPQSFLSVWENYLPFSSNLKLSSANFFSLEESKVCRLGKG